MALSRPRAQFPTDENLFHFPISQFARNIPSSHVESCMMAASTIMSEENHVDKVEKPKLPTSKDFEQKFLDYFYQLADDDGNVRKQASVDIIRSVLSPASTVHIVAYLKFTNCSLDWRNILFVMALFTQESKLLYTVGRLVQGLASTRQHARHGFYVTLTTILTSTSTTQLPNHIICETVAKRLAPKGSKSVRTQIYHVIKLCSSVDSFYRKKLISISVKCWHMVPF